MPGVQPQRVDEPELMQGYIEGSNVTALREMVDLVVISHLHHDHLDRPSLRALDEVFELRTFFEWRGLGSIDHSGVRIRPAYARFDAELKEARQLPKPERWHSSMTMWLK